MRALPAARALRPGRSPLHPRQPPRRPPPSRAARTRRPHPKRPSPTHAATHRTATRPDRLPLPRPHQPLQRRPQNRTPSRLDRHLGQPAPDRKGTTNPDPVTQTTGGRPNRPETAHKPPERPPTRRAATAARQPPFPTGTARPSNAPATSDFFSSLRRKSTTRRWRGWSAPLVVVTPS